MIPKEIKNLIEKEIAKSGVGFINEINELIFQNSPLKHNPVGFVKWVDIDEVQSNDYNPNIVASNELKLLAVSISHDGFTQPIVCVKDNKYKLPCGVISQPLNKGEINNTLWNYLKNQTQKSLPIRLVPLKEMGVLASIEKQIDIQLELVKEKKTKEKNGVIGSKTNGEWDSFKEIKSRLERGIGEIQLSGAGMLQDLIKQNSYSVVFCPICLSKEKKHWKHWNTFITEPTESISDVGMILKCNLSGIIGEKIQTENSQKVLTEPPTPLGLKEQNLDYQEIRDVSKHIIVDGFHRYYVNKVYTGICDANKGKIPIVILNKNINDRMASTIRHNRARGKHTVQGMGQLIYKMIDNGWDDIQICNELGLEPDELIRLKHISGVAKLYENNEFRSAWEESYQIKKRLEEQKRKEDKLNETDKHR